MPITREVRDPERLADPARFDLGQLTAAERLFLWRHRQPSPSGRLLGRDGRWMSQREAAAFLDVDYKLYGQLENGGQLRLAGTIDEIPTLRRELLDVVEGLTDLEPTIGELCFLARRRSGNLLMTIEREMKISRPQYHEMERAGHPWVVQYWEERGYRFPDAKSVAPNEEDCLLST